MDFYTAWRFLEDHKLFNDQFTDILDIEVVKVNVETNEIDDDDSKNTKTQVWLECGPYTKISSGNKNLYVREHDINLDCGGDTFEEAIIELAKLVDKYYTEDGVKKITNDEHNEE